MHARRLALVVATVVLCAWCGWVSGYHRTSTNAEITWAVSLAAVVIVDLALWRGRSGRRFGWRIESVREPWPRPGRGGNGAALRGTAPWLTLILAALAWDVLGIDTAPNRYHLTISALAQAYRPLNAAVLLVWVLVGVGYEVARVRAPAGEPHRRATSARTSSPAPEEGTMLGAAVVAAPTHAAAVAAGAVAAEQPTGRRRLLGRTATRRAPRRRCRSPVERSGRHRRGVRSLHRDQQAGARRPHRRLGLRRVSPLRTVSGRWTGAPRGA